MLTLCVRYLMGCVVASDVADRRRVEWPPHPGRVFMALAAAHFQTGNDSTERVALEWLETLPAPEIYAAPHIERSVVTHYVPVNDTVGPSKAPIQSAEGFTRTRQPRTFARAWLEDDTVYFAWPEAQAGTHFDALDALCSKVARIGHSSSLVQMWASQVAPEKQTNWMPNENQATDRLRVPGEGSLRYLERQFNRADVNEFFALCEAAEDASDKKRQKAAKLARKEKYQDQPPVRLRPEISLSQGYAPKRDDPEPSVSGTVFEPRLLIFGLHRADGPFRHLDLTATLQLTGRLREAMLQHLGSDAPEILTGHRAGTRSERPHAAFLPLPFVGCEHAHGGVIGVALALPRDLGTGDRQRLLKALDAVRREGLKLGPLGRWELRSSEEANFPLTLRDRIWTAVPAGTRQWATVTPYVYDRHAKAKDKTVYQQEVAEAIRASWRRIRQSGQSEINVQVVVTPVSHHLGAPASHQFPRLTRKDGSECRHTHAILIFDRPVVGPLLLGAGRYRGYGFCRPMEKDV